MAADRRLFPAAIGLMLWAVSGAGCSRSPNDGQPSPSNGSPRQVEPETSQLESSSEDETYRAQWAVVVGINHYRDTRWRALKCASQDAREFRDMLQGEFGFAADHIRYLTDDEATHAAISATLATWLPQRVQGNDAVLFYFAGHGLQNGEPPHEDGYLVPCDAHGAPPGERYLAVRWLVDQLQTLKCRHKAVILDSCYSGALFSKVRAVDRTIPGTSQRGGWDYYFKQPAFFGLTAAHDTPVDDGTAAVGHSPFSKTLLDVMRDRADVPNQQADASGFLDETWPRGTFGFTSLASRVEERVHQRAQQTPKWGALVGSEGDGDFLFRPTVERLIPSEKQQHRDYAASIQKAYENLQADRIDDADGQLSACPRPLQGWEWRHLKFRCRLNEVDRQLFDGPITGVDFSAGGQRLAVCAAGGQIILWDSSGRRHDGPEISALETHGLALDAAGRRLAMAYDETIALIAVQPERRRTLCEDMAWGASSLMAFSGDGHWLAVLGEGGAVRVWNADTGRQLASLPKLTGTAAAMSLSQDGQVLSVAVDDHVVLLRLPGGEWQTLQLDGEAKICCLAFDRSGQRLAAVDRQATVFAWKLPAATPEPPKRHELEPLPIERAALSPDQQQVAFAWADGRIQIRQVADIQARGQVTRLVGNGRGITRLCFSPDGRRLATGDDQGLFKIWKTSPTSAEFTYGLHRATVNHLAINRQGWIASADDDGAIHLWKWDPLTNEFHPKSVINAHEQAVLAVDFNSQGDLLASGGLDGLVRIWEVETGKKLHERGPPNAEDETPASIKSLGFDPTGQFVVAGYSDKNVRIWDVAHGNKVPTAQPAFIFGDSGKTSRFHKHGVCGVTYFSGGANVFSAAERVDSRTHQPTGVEWIAWQAKDGELKFRFDTELDSARYGVVDHDKQAQARTLSASSDGRWLAAAGPNLYFTVWDTDSGRLMFQAAPNDPAPRDRNISTGVAFSPDGRQLAVSSTDCALRIWDPAGETLLLEFKQLPHPAMAVAFSPDGSLLATASGTKVYVFAATGPRSREDAASGP